jgi:hypothetical protein
MWLPHPPTPVTSPLPWPLPPGIGSASPSSNDSPKPLVLNLGEMLGNGASFFPSHVSIIVADSKSQSRSYHKALGVIGGRVDDWLIPLAPGDSYSMTLSPDELKEEKTADAFQLQPGTTLAAHFTGIAPSHNNGNSIIPAPPLWKGSADSPKIAALAAAANDQ